MLRWIKSRWVRMLCELFNLPLLPKAGEPALYGLLRERSKRRRSRPAVRPALEELTERVLPSASPLAPLAGGHRPASGRHAGAAAPVGRGGAAGRERRVAGDHS